VHWGLNFVCAVISESSRFSVARYFALRTRIHLVSSSLHRSLLFRQENYFTICNWSLWSSTRGSEWVCNSFTRRCNICFSWLLRSILNTLVYHSKRISCSTDLLTASKSWTWRRVLPTSEGLSLFFTLTLVKWTPELAFRINSYTSSSHIIIHSFKRFLDIYISNVSSV